MNKLEIHKLLLSQLTYNYNQLVEQQLSGNKQNDFKSSAGDKHETGVAMAHLEQEKQGNQLRNLEQQISIVGRLNPALLAEDIRMGSLVKTSMGWFYISIAFGKLIINHELVFCMGMNAPLANVLIGKKKGAIIDWQGSQITIIQFS